MNIMNIDIMNIMRDIMVGKEKNKTINAKLMVEVK
jgi:hypothetical protein